MSKILVVDDDAHIRELVRVFLRNEGFEVVEADDGMEALSKLDSIKVDLAVIDVMMPKMDGWELCEELKASFDLPVLMLTAKGQTSQKLKGFQLGTDDYLVKPFEPLELVARVKALLKRYRIAASQTIQIGELTMNRKTFEVKVNGESMTLPLKEFELLFKLASYPGRTFSREQLIEDIWGFDFVGTDRTLDVHINRLRERFREEKHSFKITTIRGLGYRLEVTS
jgi:two-component system, OmpR family, response regulator